MFYNMFELPHTVLYVQPSDQDLAEIVSHWPTIGTSRIQRVFGIGYAHAARIHDLVLEMREKAGIDKEESEDEDAEEES